MTVASSFGAATTNALSPQVFFVIFLGIFSRHWFNDLRPVNCTSPATGCVRFKYIIQTSKNGKEIFVMPSRNIDTTISNHTSEVNPPLGIKYPSGANHQSW